MAIPEETVSKAWQRSGGKCECTHPDHWHTGRCNNTLFKAFRGELFNSYGWEIYSRDQNNAALDNCEILCTNCYLAIKKPHNP